LSQSQRERAARIADDAAGLHGAPIRGALGLFSFAAGRDIW